MVDLLTRNGAKKYDQLGDTDISGEYDNLEEFHSTTNSYEEYIPEQFNPLHWTITISKDSDFE